MVLMHLLRMELFKWINQPTSTPIILPRKDVKEAQHLQRLQAQSTGRQYLCISEWKAKKNNLTNYYASMAQKPKSEGKEDIPVVQPAMPPDAFGNFQKMASQLALQHLPQQVMMWYIGAIFGGYVVFKLPFNFLTGNFREVLHNSLAIADLHVSYMSSVSWFMVMSLFIPTFTTLCFKLGTFLFKFLGLYNEPYLSDDPFKSGKLKNLQNVNMVLTAGGVSQTVDQINSAPGAASPMALMAQNKPIEKRFEDALGGMKNSMFISPFDGIEDKFLKQFE